jgi:hypothetical protein
MPQPHHVEPLEQVAMTSQRPAAPKAPERLPGLGLIGFGLVTRIRAGLAQVGDRSDFAGGIRQILSGEHPLPQPHARAQRADGRPSLQLHKHRYQWWGVR